MIACSKAPYVKLSYMKKHRQSDENVLFLYLMCPYPHLWCLSSIFYLSYNDIDLCLEKDPLSLLLIKALSAGGWIHAGGKM